MCLQLYIVKMCVKVHPFDALMAHFCIPRDLVSLCMSSLIFMFIDDRWWGVIEIYQTDIHRNQSHPTLLS